jgi:predicted GNAT family N-acyltransferase
MLDHTDLFVAAHDLGTGRLVGFARVLTDLTYVALVLDVIVAERARGQGIGAAVMDALCSDERLATVQSMELVCQQELEPFYSRWGFTSRVGGSRLMRRTSLGLPLARGEG